MVTGKPLSVIVPAFNEEATIGHSLHRLLAQPFVGQVVVVDDGSSDATGSVAKAFNDSRVTVLSHADNRGKGAAIRTALRSCTCDFVAIQDADLEYDPAELELLLGPLVSGDADAVFGSRFVARGERRALYFWHTVGNKALTLLSNMASDINLTDMETCYKVFRRDQLTRLRIQEDGFGIEPELAIKSAINGLRIYEIGISYHGRTYEEGKKIGWRDGLEAIRCIAQYSISERRRLKRRQAVLSQTTYSELEGSLDGLRTVSNYYEWILHLAEDYLGQSIVEVGAGVGTFTPYLARQQRSVLALEPDAQLFDGLDKTCRDIAGATCLNSTSRTGEVETSSPFDSAVLINVLEHIDDDVAELTRLRAIVRPGGYIVVWVPSHEWLYSRFDSHIGHFRRYTPTALKVVVENAGLELVTLRRVNPVGALGWLVMTKILKQPPTSRAAAEAFDRFVVPGMRALDKRLEMPLGQSIFMVARVPDSI